MQRRLRRHVIFVFFLRLRRRLRRLRRCSCSSCFLLSELLFRRCHPPIRRCRPLLERGVLSLELNERTLQCVNLCLLMRRLALRRLVLLLDLRRCMICSLVRSYSCHLRRHQHGAGEPHWTRILTPATRQDGER